MSIQSEIERRHRDRKEIIAESRKIKAPVITDGDSVAEHVKIIKQAQAKCLEKCFLVDHDVQVLLFAGRLLDADTKALKDGKKVDVLTFEQYVTKAWEQVRMHEDDEAIYHERQHKEAEAKEKEDQKNGKIPDAPGQLKVQDAIKDAAGKKGKVKDDGSVAEPASEVVTKKLEEVGPTPATVAPSVSTSAGKAAPGPEASAAAKANLSAVQGGKK